MTTDTPLYTKHTEKRIETFKAAAAVAAAVDDSSHGREHERVGKSRNPQIWFLLRIRRPREIIPKAITIIIILLLPRPTTTMPLSMTAGVDSKTATTTTTTTTTTTMIIIIIIIIMARVWMCMHN
jgi:hypothetical protein